MEEIPIATSTSVRWASIIKDAKIGVTYKIRLDQMSKPHREIQLNKIRPGDLETIRSQDPFLYHSIPEVRSSEVFRREIDTSNLGVERNRTQHQSQVIKRNTRISFECHPDVFLDDDFFEE